MTHQRLLAILASLTAFVLVVGGSLMAWALGEAKASSREAVVEARAVSAEAMARANEVGRDAASALAQHIYEHRDEVRAFRLDMQSLYNYLRTHRRQPRLERPIPEVEPELAPGQP